MFKMYKTSEMKRLDYTSESTQICINLENLKIRHTQSVTVPLRDKALKDLRFKPWAVVHRANKKVIKREQIQRNAFYRLLPAALLVSGGACAALM